MHKQHDRATLGAVALMIGGKAFLLLHLKHLGSTPVITHVVGTMTSTCHDKFQHNCSQPTRT